MFLFLVHVTLFGWSYSELLKNCKNVYRDVRILFLSSFPPWHIEVSKRYSFACSILQKYPIKRSNPFLLAAGIRKIVFVCSWRLRGHINGMKIKLVSPTKTGLILHVNMFYYNLALHFLLTHPDITAQILQHRYYGELDSYWLRPSADVPQLIPLSTKTKQNKKKWRHSVCSLKKTKNNPFSMRVEWSDLYWRIYLSFTIHISLEMLWTKLLFHQHIK